jgi:glucose/arabinose dehydrogenase
VKAKSLIPAILLVAACGVAPSAGNAQNATPPRPASPIPGPPPLTPEAQIPFKMERMGEFDNPFSIAALPDGSLLVTEKPGHLQWWHDGAKTEITGTPQVQQITQGGLLDVALAPDFTKSKTLYLTYSEPRPGGASMALARATLDGTSLKNLTVLWRQGSDGKGGQFGAVMTFSPDGKYLFLASGERMRFTPAQDPNSKLGKILRLTLDGKPAPGNPQAGKIGTPTITITDPPANTEAAKTAPGRTETVEGPNTAPAETWSSGHRNQYGLAFAPDGRLWEIEFGPRGGDELNLILPGKNYGWPNVSDGENYDGVPIPKPKPGDGFERPKLFWVPSLAPSGLIIYTGKMFPQWKGDAFIGGLSGMSLVHVKIRGDQAEKADRWSWGKRIRDVAQAPDGSIWLIEDGVKAALIRLTPK